MSPRRVHALVALLLAALLLSPAAASAQSDEVIHPQDVTVATGATVTLTTGVTSGGLFVEWYRVATPADVKVKALSTDPKYSFVATAADDGARIYARILTGGRWVNTRPATVTVGDGSASIATHPQDATVLESRPVQFQVVARGTSPLSYQWQRSTDGGASWSDVAGATGAQLRLRPAAGYDGALLRAVVDNAVGGPASSNAAKLTVRRLTGTAVPVAHASLQWGISPIYQGGNPAGNGCNFFSAGKTTGFSGRVGDVHIAHRTAEGLVSVSEGTKCSPSLGQRVLFTEGTGTANPATGEATIQWRGAFTANAYSGLVPWYLEDPKLTVAANGSGTLTATAGGKGADREDPENPFTVPPREVVVATFPDVEVTADGITVKPDYAGVDYFPLVDGVRSTTSAISDALKAGNPNWGSWPQSFVDFHYETELSTYWHTSGLSADPDKPGYPFDVTFAAAPPVAQLPRVLAGPATTATLPLVEGRDVTLTADLEDATSLRWQRSSSVNGPWADLQDGEGVSGATGEALTLSKLDASWNNTYVRVRAGNDEGTVVTPALQLMSRAHQAIAFTIQPSDALTIAGSRVELQARATGHPAPVAHGAEVSQDGGATWKAIEAFERSGDDYRLLSVPAAYDGALVRATARNADGATAASEPARLTVIPATGGPQLALAPAGNVDPGVATTFTVVGAGFTIPDKESDKRHFSLDLGVFTTDGWQPGRPGNATPLATSPQVKGGQLYRGRLQDSGGWFQVTLTVPAGKLQPGAVHGVGAFLRLHDSDTNVSTFMNRAGDAWIGLPLTGQAPAAIATQPKSVTAKAGEAVELTVRASGTPAPKLQWQRRARGAAGWADLAGETGSALKLTATAADDGAAFRAVADNRLGVPASSDAAVLTVTVPHETTPTPTPTPTATATPQAQASPQPTATPVAERTPTPRPQLTVPKGHRRLAANRTATIATVACTSCSVTAPKRITVKIAGRRYALAVSTVHTRGRIGLRVRAPRAAAQRLRGRTTRLAFSVKVATGTGTTTLLVRATLAGRR
ncbi:hypothetical protein DVA67_023165 [Solirubrobacter sp. CPCC 204708]|uniref:Ig-like domain-containing protein n=1 Tax=Solirubrobacter deserti TaxID=2282478 RepID=A0ABT4RIC7_9ACTN|nr:hypothetical protein [Solirubrobacter deserti]MBE2318892.1 hypothetical protein [Solirubrobacter deserti]MDA0138273.1 hypothetical protein [Solirubrobacter deserti]